MRTKMILVAVATLLAAAEAHSVDRELAFQQNGAGACQAALPAYEGLIRKRPMAIQNEGVSTAFVTCAPVTLQGVSTSFGKPSRPSPVVNAQIGAIEAVRRITPA